MHRRTIGALAATMFVGASCIAPRSEPRAATAATASAGASAPTPRAARSETSGLPLPPGPGGLPRPTGAAGNLTVLDWAGFKGAVTYTFDDANSSQIVHYPELNALGVPMTFYLITSKPESGDPIWARAVRDGHEIANHSHTHQHRGTGDDLDAANAFLSRTLGASVWTMASPFGDPSYPPLARTRFLADRGVVNGMMAPNDATDPFNLFCYAPPGRATAAAFNGQVDAARRAGGWKIVLVHGFLGGSDSAYQPVDIKEFTASVGYARSLGDMWIDTTVAVAAYWLGQRAFTAAAPVAAGGGTTWTWTLPAHFPPGKFLRVKVDGGTPAQAGKPLAWNDHGFYEVALDAGSLTLSP